MRVIAWMILGAAAFAAIGRGQSRPDYHQYYPNIPGEVVLENDKVVVQRYVVQPGEWEGIHSHPGNQLYVHIKGGQWTVRYGTEESTSVSETGSVGWQRAVTLEERHESGNTGDTPIEFLWVTLKE